MISMQNQILTILENYIEELGFTSTTSHTASNVLYVQVIGTDLTPYGQIHCDFQTGYCRLAWIEPNGSVMKPLRSWCPDYNTPRVKQMVDEIKEILHQLEPGDDWVEQARFNHERLNIFRPCYICGKSTKGERFVQGRWTPCCFLVHTIEELPPAQKETMDWYGRITLLIPERFGWDEVQETADRIIKEQGGETDGGGMMPGSDQRDVFYSAKTEKEWDRIRIAVGNTFKVVSFDRSQDETSEK